MTEKRVNVNGLEHHSHFRKQLLSKKTLIIFVVFALFNLIFIWAGIENMFFGQISENISTRFIAIFFLISFVIYLVVGFYVKNINEKYSELLANYEGIQKQYENDYLQFVQDFQKDIESNLATEFEQMELMKMRTNLELQKARKKNELLKSNENTINVECSNYVESERIVFVKQSKNSTYTHAFFQFSQGFLHVGKANFEFSLAGSENAQNGTILRYMVKDFLFYETIKVPIDLVPNEYINAIRLGTITTEKVASLVSELGINKANVGTLKNQLPTTIKAPSLVAKNDTILLEANAPNEILL